MSMTDFSIIMDKKALRQDRIDAIKQLGIIRLHQKKEHLIQELGGEGASNLSDYLSGEDELLGQKELKRVIQRQRDQIDVRCHAAAVAAETDSKSALDWCNEMIKRHI